MVMKYISIINMAIYPQKNESLLIKVVSEELQLVSYSKEVERAT